MVTNIFQVIKPLFYCSKILGLAPFTFVNYIFQVKFSVPFLIYSVTLLLTNLSCKLVLFQKWMSTNNSSKSFFGSASTYVMAVSFAMSFVLYFFSFIKTSKLKNILVKLLLLDCAFPMTSYNKAFWLIIIMLTSSFLVPLPMIIPLILDEDTYRKVAGIVCLMDISIICVTQLHFLLLVLYLGQQFRTLNSKLQNYEKYRLVNNKALTKDISIKSIVSDTYDRNCIKDFRKIYHFLCNFLSEVNSAFSFRLLSLLTQFFFTMTYMAYYFTVDLLNLVSKSTDFSKWRVAFIVWFLWYIITLVFIVAVCKSTSKQAAETANVVHKLLNEVLDEREENELKVFSMQLVHQKPEFTACGFFIIDYTLIYNIVGAITSYLIILIQFQFNDTNKTHNA